MQKKKLIILGGIATILLIAILYQFAPSPQTEIFDDAFIDTSKGSSAQASKTRLRFIDDLECILESEAISWNATKNIIFVQNFSGNIQKNGSRIGALTGDCVKINLVSLNAWLIGKTYIKTGPAAIYIENVAARHETKQYSSTMPLQIVAPTLLDFYANGFHCDLRKRTIAFKKVKTTLL